MSLDTVPTDATMTDENAVGSPSQQQLGNGNHPGSPQGHQLTIRALVSSKEAGVIIGKAGKNVAEIREMTGCRAGVSKMVPGVQERVLSVSGSLDGVIKAFGYILNNLAENPSATPQLGANATAVSNISIKLLVANAIMGSIIGKGGATIQSLQTEHNVKIVTIKEMLANSTERMVSVDGALANVESVLGELIKIIAEQQESGKLNNHILFQPGASSANTGAAVGGNQQFAPGIGGFTPQAGNFSGYNNNRGGQRRNQQNNNNNAGGAQPAVNRTAGGAATSQAVPTPSNPELRTQNISIPSDMVGCIIGRGGTKINEIRQQSSAKISIAKDAHDESGERMFTITGTSESLEKALFLLYGQLEGEKEKRLQNQNKEGI